MLVSHARLPALITADFDEGCRFPFQCGGHNLHEGSLKIRKLACDP